MKYPFRVEDTNDDGCSFRRYNVAVCPVSCAYNILSNSMWAGFWSVAVHITPSDSLQVHSTFDNCSRFHFIKRKLFVSQIVKL